jgi:hypothetical protein
MSDTSPVNLGLNEAIIAEMSSCLTDSIALSANCRTAACSSNGGSACATCSWAQATKATNAIIAATAPFLILIVESLTSAA